MNSESPDRQWFWSVGLAEITRHTLEQGQGDYKHISSHPVLTDPGGAGGLIRQLVPRAWADAKRIVGQVNLPR